MSKDVLSFVEGCLENHQSVWVLGYVGENEVLMITSEVILSPLGHRIC